MFCQSFNRVHSSFMKDADPTTIGVCFMAALCAVLPLDISQLTFAILGAGLYALLWHSDRAPAKKPKASKMTCKSDSRVPTPKTNRNHLVTKTSAASLRPSSGPEVRKPSSQPVVAPSFQSQGWEDEVQELLSQIAPTAKVGEIVKRLEITIIQNLEKIFPEVEVTGFAHGNLNVGKAFGVAVPEVEIVAKISPQVLIRCLHGRAHQISDDVDVLKLQKSAVRACADRLVSAGGFKFRRSAFRGQQPKVTLLVPQALGLFTDSFSIDFSVNVMTPFYNASLLVECGEIDARAKGLILLVRRWAKDRGICHSAKGHLSPYIWGLLGIFFLQQSESEEKPLLPPVEQFKLVARYSQQPGTREKEAAASLYKQGPGPNTMSEKSTGTLFKEFVHFFSTEFDWRSEAVSVRSGRRAPPSSEIPKHKLSSDAFGPTIEDPFQKSHNLGDCMTVASFARLREELTRARELCERDASLSELLEPWAPPEAEDEELPKKSVEEEESTKKLLGEDGRRGAVEAQCSSAPTSIPPWRRPKQALP